MPGLTTVLVLVGRTVGVSNGRDVCRLGIPLFLDTDCSVIKHGRLQQKNVEWRGMK